MDTYIPCAFVNNFVLFRHTCTHLIFSLDKQTLFTSTHLYMYHFFSIHDLFCKKYIHMYHL